MTALDQRTEKIPVTVAAAELAAGLAAVLPHVGLRRQQTGPELTCIQLTVEPGQVTLAGTDRYTLGVCTIPTDNQAAAEHFLLKRQDAKAILGLIGRPGPGHPAVLGYHRNELTIDTLAGSLRCSGETGSYPDWGRLLEGTPADLHPGPDGLVIGFNPEYLGRFAKAREHPSDPMKLTIRGPAKAAKVQIGERFHGLIMPVRLPR